MEQILQRLLAEMDFMQERTDANLEKMDDLTEVNNKKFFIFVLCCFLTYFTR
jgi:hypothetical protein